MKAQIAQKKINFSEVMNSLLGLLTTKEKSIIERRFLLKNGKKETLESIGKSYSITRERVRQIEAVAMKKLARISMEPSIRHIHDLAHSTLVSHGKIMAEEHLISEMLKNLKESNKININAMKLAICVSEKIQKQEKNQIFKPFWYTKDLQIQTIKAGVQKITQTIEKHGEPLSLESLASRLNQYSAEMIHSMLQIHWDFLKTEKGWGMKSWRTINPRSIKDKVLVSLRKEGKPLHFSEIVDRVLHNFNSKKKVTPQAIHNDLIRHEEFTLVGRGLYGLKEWNIPSGTVCDIIISVLKENGGPMKRQSIIQAVLKKRDIRLGTISLNLQKYPFFSRVGRAVYEYVPELDKRRQKRSE